MLKGFRKASYDHNIVCLDHDVDGFEVLNVTAWHGSYGATTDMSDMSSSSMGGSNSYQISHPRFNLHAGV